jgi:hypothetical protein
MDITDLSESTQTSKNAASDPSRVLSLRRRKDLDSHILHSQLLQLRQKTITKALR